MQEDMDRVQLVTTVLQAQLTLFPVLLAPSQPLRS